MSFYCTKVTANCLYHAQTLLGDSNPESITIFSTRRHEYFSSLSAPPGFEPGTGRVYFQYSRFTRSGKNVLFVRVLGFEPRTGRV